MKHCIYKHTFPDGKVYIGQTISGNTEKRWQDGLGYQGQKKVFEAIVKFGWDNIKHEVIEDHIEDANTDARETFYIVAYDAVMNGYNSNYGHGGETWWRDRGQIIYDYLLQCRGTDNQRFLEENGIFPETEREQLDGRKWYEGLKYSAVRACQKTDRAHVDYFGKSFVYETVVTNELTEQKKEIFLDLVVQHVKKCLETAPSQIWRAEDRIEREASWQFYLLKGEGDEETAF